MKHNPMTQEQRAILENDVAEIMGNLGDIANILNACYGEKDPQVARAEEAGAAMQRLLWALQRQTQPAKSGSAAGSARVREMGNGM